jgi:hypothetical protein
MPLLSPMDRAEDRIHAAAEYSHRINTTAIDASVIIQRGSGLGSTASVSGRAADFMPRDIDHQCTVVPSCRARQTL